MVVAPLEGVVVDVEEEPGLLARLQPAVWVVILSRTKVGPSTPCRGLAHDPEALHPAVWKVTDRPRHGPSRGRGLPERKSLRGWGSPTFGTASGVGWPGFVVVVIAAGTGGRTPSGPGRGTLCGCRRRRTRQSETSWPWVAS